MRARKLCRRYRFPPCLVRTRQGVGVASAVGGPLVLLLKALRTLAIVVSSQLPNTGQPMLGKRSLNMTLFWRKARSVGHSSEIEAMMVQLKVKIAVSPQIRFSHSWEPDS